MGTSTDQEADTRQRVLESACRLFAEEGYHNTTIHEICDEASANVAAVNYYFRDKESLYVEALRHAYALAQDAHPMDGGLPPDAPARDRLKAHIAAVIRRVVSDGPPSYFHRIHVKEMAEPTPGVHRRARGLIDPLRKNMQSIIKQLLGDGADHKAVRLCMLSVVSQFLFLGLHREARERLFSPRQRRQPPSVDEVIDHVTSFSLAGIETVRSSLEAGDAH